MGSDAIGAGFFNPVALQAFFGRLLPPAATSAFAKKGVKSSMVPAATSAPFSAPWGNTTL